MKMLRCVCLGFENGSILRTPSVNMNGNVRNLYPLSFVDTTYIPVRLQTTTSSNFCSI